MLNETIVLPRTTDSGAVNPLANNARLVVFRNDDDEVIIQCNNMDEIEHFLVKLRASLRGSCEETRVTLPTVSIEGDEGVLEGAVVKHYFPVDNKTAEFWVDTVAQRVTVKLSRIPANQSLAKPAKRRTRFQP